MEKAKNSGNMSQNISEVLASIDLQKPSLSTLAQRGDDSLVEQFLTENVKISGEEKDTVRSQLYMASFWGIFDAVKVIVGSGADINCQNPSSLWTPLHAACFQEHGKVIMFLLENDADVTLEDSQGRTAVDFGSASDKVWPLFAVHGYVRTPEADLMQKGILKKTSGQQQIVTGNVDMDMNSFRKSNSLLPINFDENTLQGKNDRNAYAASIDGDVLAGDTTNSVSEEQPNFNAWRN